MQLEEVAARQDPVPLQCEMGVYVEPEQDSVPHDTVVAASWQPAAPLQKPVLPQGGLAAQRFAGSGLPRGTFAQLPALAPTLHDVHSEQPLLRQQTPSTQNRPVKHSLVAAQGWPGRFRLPQRFVFGSQMVGDTQFASLVHAARQAVAPLQTYGAHVMLEAGWQTPRPLQVRPVTAVDWPVGHDGPAQDVLAS